MPGQCPETCLCAMESIDLQGSHGLFYDPLNLNIGGNSADNLFDLLVYQIAALCPRGPAVHKNLILECLNARCVQVEPFDAQFTALHLYCRAAVQNDLGKTMLAPAIAV